MSQIESKQYTLEKAFKECFYVVPDYQREYVWTDKEVQQLVDDIDDQFSAGSNREYFVGTVLVSPSGDQSDHYEVIDGQQRLTTFFLLLCALRHLSQEEKQYPTLGNLISTSYTTSDGDTKRSLKLSPRYEGANELMERIVAAEADPQTTRSSIQSSGLKTFGSLDRLLGAYRTLYRNVTDNYGKKEELRKYWGYLATNVVFIQITTDVSSALKIFETINERGVGLNPMDLLKNLLFTHVSPTDFTSLKNEWKKITAPLEKAKEKPLRFLRYFLMANFHIQNPRGDAVVREDEIYDWLTNDGNAAVCEYRTKPFEFVRRIARDVDHYVAFGNGLGNDGHPNVAMDNLRRLTGGAFSLHYVLLIAASNFPKPLFDYFVTQLESFLFYYIFTKTPTKELERNFSIWADELRAISAEVDPEVQKRRLNEFIAERFARSMAVKEGELSDALKRYTLYAMQRYRTQYLLNKLTQYVDMAYRGLRVAGPLAEYNGAEIEHILPNTPETDLRDDFVARNPEADYDAYKNKLGNLTLLEKPINIVASNKFFDAKKEKYTQCKYYLTSSIARLEQVGSNSSITRINTKLLAFDNWTAEAIDRRQDLLIDLSREVWKVRPIDEPSIGVSP
jgi:hypothetical protein